MSLRPWITAILTVGVMSEVVYFLYRKKVHQKLWRHVFASSASEAETSVTTAEVTVQSRSFHKVLFFPDPQRICADHFLSERGCHRPKCPFSHKETNFSRMISYLLLAKETLDVCMYTISNNDLADIVIKLHERGVVVRIITDDEAVNLSGNYIGKFRRSGIQVRRDYSSYLMHHKFVIVDKTTLLNGSFNWTCLAVNSNNENVLITNNPEIVQPYCAEYEKLWEMFDPAKRQLKE
uniref:Mitochondrial cardiolipin hydrolase n=1 Tax=Asterias rubens TaxID=7604 RepID=A0A2S1PRU9_ASTRU|nr:putative zucchini [Asterias rubens]